MDRMDIQVEPLDLRIKKTTNTTYSTKPGDCTIFKQYFREHMENTKKNSPFPYNYEPVDHKVYGNSTLQSQHTQSDCFGKTKIKACGNALCDRLPSAGYMPDSTSKHFTQRSNPSFCIRKPAIVKVQTSNAANQKNIMYLSTKFNSCDSNILSPSFYQNTWIPPFSSSGNLNALSYNSKTLNNTTDSNVHTPNKFHTNQELVRNYLSKGISDRTLSQRSNSSEWDMMSKKVPSSYTVTIPQALPFTTLREEENFATVNSSKEENMAIVNKHHSLCYDKRKDLDNNCTVKAPLRRIAPKQNQIQTPPIMSWSNPSFMQDTVLSPASKKRFNGNSGNQTLSTTKSRTVPLMGNQNYRTVPLMGNQNYRTVPLMDNQNYRTVPLMGNQNYRTVPLMGNQTIPTLSQKPPVTINNTALHSYLLNKEHLPDIKWKIKDDNNNDQSVVSAYHNVSMEQNVIGIKPIEQTRISQNMWSGCTEALPQEVLVSSTTDVNDRRGKSSQQRDDDYDDDNDDNDERKSHLMTYKNINKVPSEHGRCKDHLLSLVPGQQYQAKLLGDRTSNVTIKDHSLVPDQQYQARPWGGRDRTSTVTIKDHSLVPDQQYQAKQWGDRTSTVTIYKPKYYFMNKFSQTSDDDNNNQTYDCKNVKDKEILPCVVKDESLDSGNDTDSDDTWNYSEGWGKWMSGGNSERTEDYKDINTGNRSQRKHSVDEPSLSEKSVQSPDLQFQNVSSDTYVHKLKKFSCTIPKKKIDEGRKKKERRRMLPKIPVDDLGVNSPSDLRQCEPFFWCHCCERSLKHDASYHFMEHGNGSDANLDKYYLQVYGQVTKHWKGFNKEWRCVYLCGLCDQAMLYHQGFRWHILTHGKGHRCEKCNKHFISKMKLTQHQNYGCDDKINCCSICGRKFSSTKHLKIHARVHRRSRPSVKYDCSYCGKRLSSRGSLTTHTRLHTGINPYMCNLCGRSYPQNVQLKLHMKVHRKIEDQ